MRASPNVLKSLFILTLFFTSPFEAWGENGRDEYKKAQYYFPYNKEKALIHYRNSIKENPKLWNAWFGKAQCNLALGNPDEALSALLTADELEPDNTLIFTALGDTYIALTKYGDAVKYFTKAIDLGDEATVTEGYFRRGRAYFLKEDFENAVKDFTRAEGMRKSGAFSHNRGLAEFMLEDFDAALKSFQKAIKYYKWEHNPQGHNEAQRQKQITMNKMREKAEYRTDEDMLSDQIMREVQPDPISLEQLMDKIDK